MQTAGGVGGVMNALDNFQTDEQVAELQSQQVQEAAKARGIDPKDPANKETMVELNKEVADNIAIAQQQAGIGAQEAGIGIDGCCTDVISRLDQIINLLGVGGPPTAADVAIKESSDKAQTTSKATTTTSGAPMGKHEKAERDRQRAIAQSAEEAFSTIVTNAASAAAPFLDNPATQVGQKSSLVIPYKANRTQEQQQVAADTMPTTMGRHEKAARAEQKEAEKKFGFDTPEMQEYIEGQEKKAERPRETSSWRG